MFDHALYNMKVMSSVTVLTQVFLTIARGVLTEMKGKERLGSLETRLNNTEVGIEPDKNNCIINWSKILNAVERSV